jgi:hypothetical protein
MEITLNHTIVPAHDKEASAKFIAKMFGIEYKGPHGHFAPVQVNSTLTLDFDNREGFQSHHYAFHVSDETFDEVLGRIKADRVAFGAYPNSQDDGKLNDRLGGRGFYFKDANGHSWELMTRIK